MCTRCTVYTEDSIDIPVHYSIELNFLCAVFMYKFSPKDSVIGQWYACECHLFILPRPNIFILKMHSVLLCVNPLEINGDKNQYQMYIIRSLCILLILYFFLCFIIIPTVVFSLASLLIWVLWFLTADGDIIQTLDKVHTCNTYRIRDHNSFTMYVSFWWFIFSLVWILLSFHSEELFFIAQKNSHHIFMFRFL